jgi:large subunit ribosomal protein L18
MAQKSRSEARLRRHKRVRKTVTGNSGRPRLNVFRSSAEVYAQVIDDGSGCTLTSASTVDCEIRPKVKGLSKTEQAKVVGQVLAERARNKGVTTVVFDRGGFRYMGRVKALAESARQGGLEF